LAGLDEGTSDVPDRGAISGIAAPPPGRRPRSDRRIPNRERASASASARAARSRSSVPATASSSSRARTTGTARLRTGSWPHIAMRQNDELGKGGRAVPRAGMSRTRSTWARPAVPADRA